MDHRRYQLATANLTTRMRYLAKVVSGLLALALAVIAAPLFHLDKGPAILEVVSTHCSTSLAVALPEATTGRSPCQVSHLPRKCTPHSRPILAEVISDTSDQEMRFAATVRSAAPIVQRNMGSPAQRSGFIWRSAGWHLPQHLHTAFSMLRI